MKHGPKAYSIVRQSVKCSSIFVRHKSLKTQFNSIKKQYPGYILLFQVGDFYEIFGDDAGDVIPPSKSVVAPPSRSMT